MGDSRSKYSKEFKIEAVSLHGRKKFYFSDLGYRPSFTSTRNYYTASTTEKDPTVAPSSSGRISS